MMLGVESSPTRRKAATASKHPSDHRCPPNGQNIAEKYRLEFATVKEILTYTSASNKDSIAAGRPDFGHQGNENAPPDRSGGAQFSASLRVPESERETNPLGLLAAHRRAQQA